MSDRLYLSLWLKEGPARSTLSRFVRVLGKFPFSVLSPGIALTIRAVSTQEAPLHEESFPSADVKAIEEAAAAWTLDDASVEAEGAWDLLAKDGDAWKLKASRVTIAAYGPDFEREDGEDIRIEFGTDSAFLPVPESPESCRNVQENNRSQLRLVKELE